MLPPCYYLLHLVIMSQFTPVRHTLTPSGAHVLVSNMTPQWLCHGLDTRKDERPRPASAATEGSAKSYLANSRGRPSSSLSEEPPTITYT